MALATQSGTDSKLLIPDLEQLLSIPGSSDPDLAIELMAGEIEAFLNRTSVEELPGRLKLEQDIEELRSFRQETLEAIEAARDLHVDSQVAAHQREYASRFPQEITFAVEEVFKNIIHRELGFLTRIWGREIDSEGFHEQTLKGTTTVIIPGKALKLIRDRILPCQDKIPFKRGFKVMVKGDDPFLVMEASCGSISAKIALDQWE